MLARMRPALKIGTVIAGPGDASDRLGNSGELEGRYGLLAGTYGNILLDAHKLPTARDPRQEGVMKGFAPFERGSNQPAKRRLEGLAAIRELARLNPPVDLAKQLLIDGHCYFCRGQRTYLQGYNDLSCQLYRCR